MSISTLQRAVMIDQFKGKPCIKYIPVPDPKQGEILIRVECCPINPADNSFLKGKYISKRVPPTTIGLEGSGVVVKCCDNDELGQQMLGKHVSFISKDEIIGS